MVYYIFRGLIKIPIFRDYRPQKVTILSYFRWLIQYEIKDWKNLIKLFCCVIYYSEKRIQDALIKLNQSLQSSLSKDGFDPKKIIYIQFHEAGSSSPVMLNILRDKANLQRMGCHFLDGKDVRGILDVTNKLSEGAIIFIDDFAGTGNQFFEAYNLMSQYIIGNYSQFFLIPCICEEAAERVDKQGITIFTDLVHKKTDRPLHNESSMFDEISKKRLIELSSEIDPKHGLGYKGIASMVVLYSNSPNSVPLLLRGNINQKPKFGFLPRTTDLPVSSPN